ncbi:MAG: DMT family transporter [Pseudomonadota bacterium]
MNRPILAALVAVLIWGASPAATALAAQTIPASLIGPLRTVLAAAVMLPVLPWFWNSFPRELRARSEIVLGGVAGFALYPIFLSIGVAQTSVSHASLILAAAPIFTGLMSFVVTRCWPQGAWWFGAAVSLCGVALLVSSTGFGMSGFRGNMRGDALVLLSVLFASLGYVCGGRVAARIGKWPATFWMLTVGALVLLPFWLLPAATYSWDKVSWQSTVGLLFLVLAVTILAYALWFWSLGTSSASRITPLQFGQPLVGVALASIMFGEPVTGFVLASGCLIICGVFISGRT